jgi:hypothetical protein
MGIDPNTPDASGGAGNGAPPEPDNQGRPSFSERVSEHPRWKLATAIIGTLAALVGIIGFAYPILFSSQAGPGTGAATSTSVATPAQPAVTTAATTAPTTVDPTTEESPTVPASGDVVPAPAVGDCLGTDRRPLPCTATHRFEVVAVDTPECDAAVALPYLGGNPDLDILRARFTVSDVHACLVADHGDADRSATIKGILAVTDPAAGSPFRLCRDDRTTPTEVGCDVPHTSEFIGSLGVPAPTTADCEAAATAYLSRTYKDFSDRLKVTAIPTSDPSSGAPTCVITTRGNAVLTQSIRNVRTNALPLRAG